MAKAKVPAKKKKAAKKKDERVVFAGRIRCPDTGGWVYPKKR